MKSNNKRLVVHKLPDCYVSDAVGGDLLNATRPLLDFWQFQMSARGKRDPGKDVRKTVYQRGIRDLREMHRLGVRIMAGTDLGAPLIFPGVSLHDELVLLVERAGMTPMEALQSATRNPAEFFSLQRSLGTIEVGKIADLVLLDANPLEYIGNTRRINSVVVNGRYLSKEALQKMLADAEKK